MESWRVIKNHHQAEDPSSLLRHNSTVNDCGTSGEWGGEFKRIRMGLIKEVSNAPCVQLLWVTSWSSSSFLLFFVILLMLKDQPAVIRAPEVTVTLCPVAGCPNKTGREAATKGGL